MNRMFVPRSIRLMRHKPVRQEESDHNTLNSLMYINSVIKKVIVSEKYLMQPNLFVLEVDASADKIKLARALNSISIDNPVKKINSLVYKPTNKIFRGKRGKTSYTKRMCITFTKPFDINLIYTDTDGEEK